jgi:hypothetical protein
MGTWNESMTRDASLAREIAIKHLAKAKREEQQQEKMYRWRRGSLIVARNTESGLRETVKALGYEWSEGRFGD